MKFSKLGLIFSLSYLGIFLLSGFYAIYLLVFHTANSEFSGLLGIVVTFPWSLIFLPIINSLGFVAWYDQFTSNPAVYGFFGMLGLLPAALLNAVILYFIGRLFGGAVKKENLGNEISTPTPANVDSLWKKFNLFFWIFFFLSIISFSLIFLPTAQLVKYISIASALRMIAKVGSIIVLSYFGYVITQKRQYLLLGLLGLFSGMFGMIGLIIGYIVLWHGRKNLRLG